MRLILIHTIKILNNSESKFSAIWKLIELNHREKLPDNN
jgi:hypothetical protein